MIKAKLQGIKEGHQRSLLVFGIDGENVTRLVAGEPIMFELEEMGIPDHDICIYYGKTQEDLFEQFELLVEKAAEET